MIATVAAIIDARDQAVAGHSNRVAKYAVAFGEELGLAPTELAELHTAGLLHDLGKIAVPEAILHKPAKLTAGGVRRRQGARRYRRANPVAGRAAAGGLAHGRRPPRALRWAWLPE